MAKKIKELTNLIEESDWPEDRKQRARIVAGTVALSNEYYEQAWDHFYSMYSLKDVDFQKYRTRIAEGAYGLCQVLQEIPNDHELLQSIIDSDHDIIQKKKSTTVTNNNARKFIGRKYLLYAANECDYLPAIIEYGWNCLASGHATSFVFEYNERDAKIGLQWAKRILDRTTELYKGQAYAMYAKYYFADYSLNGTKESAKAFCDYAVKARYAYKPTTNEYILYFYAHLCANPNFKDYKDGEYHNPKHGYELFCKVAENAKDPDIQESAQSIKEMMEQKYPSKIR